MNTQVLVSTFFLTILLMVGLLFFIRASVKERTEQIKFKADLPQESLLTQLQQYFEQRAYKISAVDKANNLISFQGFVRPSWFLAVFLTLLAAFGLLCLGLVLSILFPTVGNIFVLITFLSPVAGIFYWRGAARFEQVLLKFEQPTQGDAPTIFTVTGHRDELLQFRQSLPLKLVEE